jgi:hypothetical protein
MKSALYLILGLAIAGPSLAAKTSGFLDDPSCDSMAEPAVHAKDHHAKSVKAHHAKKSRSAKTKKAPPADDGS